MKKSCILLVFIWILVLPAGVSAQNEYTIKDYSANIQVDDSKVSQVNLTLILQFNQEQSQFIWQIPHFDRVEDYWIDNVEMTGAQAEVTERPRYYELLIKPTDAASFSGRVKVTISYQLHGFKDQDDQADWYYGYLVPASPEAVIENAQVTIAFPGEQILSPQFAMGPYGVGGSDDLNIQIAKNRLRITTLRPLAIGEAVFIKAQLTPATFEKAPQESSKYVIEQFNSQIDVDNQRITRVREEVTFRFSEEVRQVRRGLNLTDPVSEDAIILRNLTLEEGKVTRESDENGLAMLVYEDNGRSMSGRQTFVYTYELVFPDFRVDGVDSFHMAAPGYYWFCPIEQYELRLVLPGKAKTYDAYVGRNNEGTAFDEKLAPVISLGSENDPSEMRKRILNVSGQNLAPRQSVMIETTMLAYTFVKKWNTAEEATPFVTFTAIFLSLLLLFFCGRRYQPQLWPSWQIPANLNPAEIRFLLDGRTNSSDGTALLFDWASRGHLFFQQTANGPVLRRGQPLADDAPSYEKDLYRSLWYIEDKDARSEIPVRELRTFLVDFLSSLRFGIHKRFRYEHRFRDRRANVISWLSTILALAPGLALAAAIATNLQISLVDTPLKTAFFAIFLLLFCLALHGWLRFLRRVWTRQDVSLWRTLLAVTIIILLFITVAVIMLAAYWEVHFPPIIISILGTYLIVFLAALIKRPSRYGQQIYSEVLDFCSLIAGEDDVLPPTQAEATALFWRLLPYAIGLGLLPQWIKRFAGRSLATPSWYETGNSVMDSVALGEELARLLPLLNRKFHAPVQHTDKAAVTVPSLPDNETEPIIQYKLLIKSVTTNAAEDDSQYNMDIQKNEAEEGTDGDIKA